MRGTMSRFRRFVVGVSPRRPRLNSGLIFLGLVLDEVALDRI
jgi:hypothetical protein